MFKTALIDQLDSPPHPHSEQSRPPEPLKRSALTTLTYRAEIDGLRALAVAAVVMYHLDLGLPGGYVGVDIFFVISGFLIVSLLLRDFQGQAFSYADFWERRIRRIFPAMAATTLATLLVSRLIFLPEDFSSIGKAAFAQVALSSNLFFWKTQGYFEHFNSHPLLHHWSLAVEEQFYISLPILFWFFYRLSLFDPLKASRIFLLVAGLLSLALSALLFTFDREFHAFYLLPARAWEFICGALLASLPPTWFSQSRFVREGASWGGLALILWATCTYHRLTPFPGLMAVPPCLGAALILWSNTRLQQRDSLTVLGKTLAWKPFVFLGLISYSLYLWHWPIWISLNYWNLDLTPSPTVRLAAVALSLFAAILSWRYIETPFRKKEVCKSSTSMFAFAGLGSMSILAAGSLLLLSAPKPSQDNASSVPITHLNIENDQPPSSIVVNDPANTILLWGDSHARHLIEDFVKECRSAGIQPITASFSATPPLLDPNMGNHLTFNLKKRRFAQFVRELILQHSLKNIVLVAQWGRYQVSHPTALREELLKTLQFLEELDCRVWVIMGTPYQDRNIYSVFQKLKSLPERSSLSHLQTVEWHYASTSILVDIAKENSFATFIDPAKRFIIPGTNRYRIEMDGKTLYFDSNHLTPHATTHFVIPSLKPIFETVRQDASSK